MIEIDAVGAIASLLEKRSIEAEVGGIRARRRAPCASVVDASSHWPRTCLNIFLFHTLAMTDSSGMPLACRKEWKPMTPRPTERSRIAAYGRAREVGAGGVDEALQHVVEEAHHVLDEVRMLVPLEIGLEVERRQAADRGALLAVMVDAGRQRDLAAQVRGLDLEARPACDARARALFTWSTNTRYGSPVSTRAVRMRIHRARAETRALHGAVLAG